MDVHACRYGYTCVQIYVYRGQRSTSGFIPEEPSIFCSFQSLSLAQNASSARLASQWALGTSLSPPHSTGVIGAHYHAHYFMWVLGIKLDYHSYATGSLPMEPSPSSASLLGLQQGQNGCHGVPMSRMGRRSQESWTAQPILDLHELQLWELQKSV